MNYACIAHRETKQDIYSLVRFINKYISKQIKWKRREMLFESQVCRIWIRRNEEYLNDDRREFSVVAGS